jgi:hypothetical protein
MKSAELFFTMYWPEIVLGPGITVQETTKYSDIYYLELLSKNRSHAIQVILPGDVRVVHGQTLQVALLRHNGFLSASLVASNDDTLLTYLHAGPGLLK